jgi:hypothetical protein
MTEIIKKPIIKMQIAYIIMFCIFFFLFQKNIPNYGAVLFIILLAIILSFVHSTLLYFLKLGVKLFSKTKDRYIYIICFGFVYLINFCCYSLFSQSNIDLDKDVSSKFLTGYFGLSSIVFILILLTPLNKIFLK